MVKEVVKMKGAGVTDLIRRYEEAGQGHVFAFFDKLSDDLKQVFLDRARSIDLERMSLVIREALSKKKEKQDIGKLRPVRSFSLGPVKKKELEMQAILKLGEDALRAGKVGALVVAGGDGTRLGFEGPKGVIPITPIMKKSFFQVFAEKIKAAQKQYHCVIPWYIMTSEFNDSQTRDFFDENNGFGLKKVYFFKQGMMPVVDFNGKFLLDENGLIAMAPDGHGGCFEALLKSGMISKMEKQGVEVISYFQVDNPLVSCIDPWFIGLHIFASAKMSSKVVKRVDPGERVGIFCWEGNQLRVVEYSDASEEMLNKRRKDGKLSFNAANIAVHLLDRQFIQDKEWSEDVVFHVAEKRVKFMDFEGGIVNPLEPNAIKFEKFIFDAFGKARNCVLMEVSREEEFSPVKNREGKDSPESCRRDMLRRCVRWLKAARVNIDGLPLFDIEISPSFADTEEAFVEKWKSLPKKMKIEETTYLE